MRRLNVLPPLLEAVRHRRETDAVTFQTLVDTLVHRLVDAMRDGVRHVSDPPVGVRSDIGLFASGRARQVRVRALQHACAATPRLASLQARAGGVGPSVGLACLRGIRRRARLLEWMLTRVALATGRRRTSRRRGWRGES